MIDHKIYIKELEARLAQAESQAAAARVAAQEATADLVRLTSVDLLNITSNSITMGIPNWAMEFIAQSLAETMESAPNYIEFHCRLEMKDYIITCQRKSGKTPHELRKEAELQIQGLREQLTAWERITDPDDPAAVEWIARAIVASAGGTWHEAKDFQETFYGYAANLLRAFRQQVQKEGDVSNADP